MENDLETYVIEGTAGSGDVTLNGPAARKVQKGDVIIIICYAQMVPGKSKTISSLLLFFLTNQPINSIKV